MQAPSRYVRLSLHPSNLRIISHPNDQTAMYRLQLSLTGVPMVNQQPLPLTRPSVMMQQPLITQGHNSMPFSAGPTSIYPMQQHRNRRYQSHAPQGYNAPYSSGPVYPMGQQYPDRHYHWRNQIPQGYNAPYSAAPVYPMCQRQHPNRPCQSPAPQGYNAPFSAGPVYRIGQQHPNRHWHHQSHAP